VDVREFQRHAEQFADRGDGDDAGPILAAGCELAAAASVVAGTVARGQTGLLGERGYRERLREGLGDLLVRAALLAGAAKLNLGDVAAGSLAVLADMEKPDALTAGQTLAVFDAGYPEAERLPRYLVVEFAQHTSEAGGYTVAATLQSMWPPLTDERGSLAAGTRGPRPGDHLGDPLTDNAREPDGYRFHDAIHLGFLTVLGWSPTMRALLRRKRKSDRVVDECEDGARAVFAEEGLAAILARLAEPRDGFRRYRSVTQDVVELARAATTGLEVNAVPGWLWREAIWQGFCALDQLITHGGGLLIADLDGRQLTYQPSVPSAVAEPEQAAA